MEGLIWLAVVIVGIAWWLYLVVWMQEIRVNLRTVVKGIRALLEQGERMRRDAAKGQGSAIDGDVGDFPPADGE